jgi:DNA end-binding protein Ku
MPVRALWEGIIRLGNEEIPVKFYAALEDRDIHFRLLHRSDREPVKQKMVDSETGKEVDPGAVRKGAEIRRGVYVLLEEEELAKLDPEPSRIVSVESLVDRSKVGHPRYDRPYFLGPDGDEGAESRRALEKDVQGSSAGSCAGRKYVGSFVQEGYLLIITPRIR